MVAIISQWSSSSVPISDEDSIAAFDWHRLALAPIVDGGGEFAVRFAQHHVL
jgi:hypothetical protein